MDKFQSGSIVIMLVFYGIYFGKMLGQKKKGIRTNQIAKGDKAEELLYIEFIMKIATIGVPVYELVSIFWGINQASENLHFPYIPCATAGVQAFRSTAEQKWCQRESILSAEILRSADLI